MHLLFPKIYSLLIELRSKTTMNINELTTIVCLNYRAPLSYTPLECPL